MIDELAKVLRESYVYFNVGGQFGYTTVVAEGMGVAPSNIYVFEGNTFRSRVLGKNCPDDVTIVPEFVGEDEKNTISIDNFVDEHPTPDVVKIDVEGMEFDVLQGMTDTLRDESPILFVEVHDRFLPEYGVSPEDVFEFLEQYGYTLAKANHRAKDEEFVDVDEPLEPSSYLLKTVPE